MMMLKGRLHRVRRKKERRKVQWRMEDCGGGGGGGRESETERLSSLNPHKSKERPSASASATDELEII